MFVIVDNVSQTSGRRHFLPKLIDYMIQKGLTFEVVQTNHELVSLIETHHIRGVILTGSPLMITEPLSLPQVAANTLALLELSCPILGICFGMQWMVVSYGGSLTRLTAFQKGWRKLNFAPSYLTPQHSKQCVIEAYHDAVDHLPIGFRVIAQDDITHDVKGIERTHPVYRAGLLFHPEGDPSTHVFLDRFIDLCS